MTKQAHDLLELKVTSITYNHAMMQNSKQQSKINGIA